MKPIILFLLTLFASTNAFSNEVASVGGSEKQLTGSDMQLKDAISISTSIYKGVITELGHYGFGPIGVFVYGNVITKPSEDYLGAAPPSLKLTLRVVHRPQTVDESEPETGKPYVFIVCYKDNRNYVVNFSRHNDNIAKVKALIAAAPASK